eukprot:COSAG02_NODE_7858_length_2814_cov_350.860773_4_plen_54_part_00
MFLGSGPRKPTASLLLANRSHYYTVLWLQKTAYVGADRRWRPASAASEHRRLL